VTLVKDIVIAIVAVIVKAEVVGELAVVPY